jgi:hypothetical protein
MPNWNALIMNIIYTMESKITMPKTTIQHQAILSEVTVSACGLYRTTTIRVVATIKTTATCTTMMYELHTTALFRLNFMSVSNPAIGENTAMKMKIIIRSVGSIDE